MFSEHALKKFHLVQTSGQLIVLLLCGVLGLVNTGLFKQSQMLVLLACLALTLLEFTLLVPEEVQPPKWRSVSHYLETIVICYALPQSLFFLTQVLNHYHLVNMTLWMVLITLYSLVMYIPMAALALRKVKNNWGRIILLGWFIFDSAIGTPSIIAGSLPYAKILMQLNNSGFSGTFVLIIVTLIVMSDWKIQRPHFTFSRHSSFWVSSLIVLLLAAHLCFILLPTLVDALHSGSVLNYYLGKISGGIVFTSFEAGIAEEWLMRFIVIALLAQIFAHNRYRIYLIVLFDGLLFGLWHLSNVRYQTLSATLMQVVAIGGWTLVISAVYLYTHALLLTMVYHGLYDFILFFRNSGIDSTGNAVRSTTSPTAYQWQVTLIMVAIYFVIALIIISGKRKHQAIEDNLASM